MLPSTQFCLNASGLPLLDSVVSIRRPNASPIHSSRRLQTEASCPLTVPNNDYESLPLRVRCVRTHRFRDEVRGGRLGVVTGIAGLEVLG
jgi:hypothetical protein